MKGFGRCNVGQQSIFITVPSINFEPKDTQHSNFFFRKTSEFTIDSEVFWHRNFIRAPISNLAQLSITVQFLINDCRQTKHSRACDLDDSTARCQQQMVDIFVLVTLSPILFCHWWESKDPRKTTKQLVNPRRSENGKQHSALHANQLRTTVEQCWRLYDIDKNLYYIFNRQIFFSFKHFVNPIGQVKSGRLPTHYTKVI